MGLTPRLVTDSTLSEKPSEHQKSLNWDQIEIEIELYWAGVHHSTRDLMRSVSGSREWQMEAELCGAAGFCEWGAD